MIEMLTQNRKWNVFNEMTKHIRVCFRLTILMLMVGSASASPTGVADGTKSNLLMYNLYNDSYGQQIIYQNVINANRDITPGSFCYSYDSTTRGDERNIYLGHTKKTELKNNAGWVSNTDLNQDLSCTETTASISTNHSTVQCELDNRLGYNFNLKSVCSLSDESILIGSAGYTTSCGIATVPYLMDFETATIPDLPNCTSSENNGIGNDWKTKIAPLYFTGKVLNYSWHSPVGEANSWFYTQGLELEAGVNYDISYKYGNNSGTWTESMKVAYGTSAQESAMTNQLADYPAIELATPAEEFITFTVASNGIYYFGFNVYSVDDQNQLYLDDISIVASPSCPVPSDLAAVVTGEDSADLTWINNANVTQWEVIFGIAGFDPLIEGTTVYGNANTGTTLNGLTANTNYDFYVKSICGASDESTLAGPTSFKTICGSMVDMFEGFEEYTTGSIVPDCWDRIVPAVPMGSQTISSTNAASGVRNIYQYAGSTSNAIIVVLPLFENINAGTHWLRLKARVSSGAPGTLSVGYVTDVNDYSSFSSIQDLSITNTSYTSDGSEYTVGVPTSVPTNARLAIKNANDGKSYYWDDVYWEIAPSCLPVSDLSVAAVSPSSIDLTWSSGGSQESWNISLGTPGYIPGDADEIYTDNSTSNSYHITGLTADTNYDVYVQANCSQGGNSTWVGPLTVYTGYCIPTSTGSDAYIVGFTATGNSGQDIENLNTGASLNGTGHSDYTNLPALIASPASEVEFTVNIGPGNNTTGLKIWVDWDQNLMFGDQNSGELVHISTGYKTTHTGSFTIPENAFGTYRIRVGASYTPLSGPASPCALSSSGEYEDYIIEVAPLENCTEAIAGIPNKAALEVCAGNGFTLSVSGATEPGDGLLRVWQSSPAGDNVWTNIDGAGSTFYTVINGVLDATDYRYIVTCTVSGGGEESDESDIIQVTLAPASECYCESYATSVEAITYVSFGNIDNNTNASSSIGYEDFTEQTTGVNLGETYSITLKGNTGGNFVNRFTVFIDWNQNGVLDDAGEVYIIEQSIRNSSGTDNISATENIEVPANATEGNTRMRIVKNFNSPLIDPCGSFSFGQTEDYTVIVTTDAGAASLYGSVTWNSNCGERNATVKLYEPGTATEVASYDVSIQADGTFNISGLEIGTFDVIVKLDGYLAKGTRNVVIAAGANSLAVGAILFGDFNGDNFIDFGDFGVLSGAFLIQYGVDPGYNLLLDHNCDGIIDFSDFGALSGSFSIIGDSAPLGN